MEPFRICARGLLVAVVLGSSGCDRIKARQATADGPTPISKLDSPEPPSVVRLASPERLSVEDAMRFEDVSFMLRTGTSEAEVLSEIVRRGLVDPITPAQAQGLSAYGASAKFISSIQNPRYVLSFAEREQYNNRVHSRSVAVRGQMEADRKQREAEFAENRRQYSLQQQTLANVAVNERAQRQREEAKKEYERRRKYLEDEIQQTQTRMNQYRRYGYRESDLTGQERHLRELREELSNLKSP